MTANVEAIFYQGETPWHGIGQPIAKGATITEACAGVPELAMRVTAYGAQISEGPFAGKAIERRAIVRDDGQIVGEVGPGFEPVQSEEAFRMFAPWLESGAVQLETGGTLADGSRMFLLGRLVGAEQTIGRDDRVNGYVLFAHAHDGSLSVRAGLTATRVVCCNTLAMAVADWRKYDRGPGGSGKATQHTIRHTKSVHDKIIDAGDSITRAVASLREAGDRWRRMAEIQVRPTDAMLRAYLVGVFGRPEIDAQRKARSEKRASTPRMDAVSALMEGGRGTDLAGVRGTAWGLYNAVTEYLTHVHGRGTGASADKRRADRNAFGDGASELARAESLALAADRITGLDSLVTLGAMTAAQATAAAA